MTGEEYFKLLCSIKTVSKIEWFVKGDPWDSDVCGIRVYSDKGILDMVYGYPKHIGFVMRYDCLFISYALWKLRKTYGEKEAFKPIFNVDLLTKEINSCIQLAKDNGQSINFNIVEEC